MAKRPTRSQAADVTTQARPKSRPRTPGARELATGAVANREPDLVKLDDSGRAAFSTVAGSGGRQPSEEEIRRRAYEMYLERGASDGQEFDDWLKAEQELRESKPASSMSRS